MLTFDSIVGIDLAIGISGYSAEDLNEIMPRSKPPILSLSERLPSVHYRRK